MEVVKGIYGILKWLGIIDFIAGYLPEGPSVKINMPWEGLTEVREVYRYAFYALVGALWLPVIFAAYSLFTF